MRYEVIPMLLTLIDDAEHSAIAIMMFTFPPSNPSSPHHPRYIQLQGVLLGSTEWYPRPRERLS
jgi:hypothetical protein